MYVYYIHYQSVVINFGNPILYVLRRHNKIKLEQF